MDDKDIAARLAAMPEAAWRLVPPELLEHVWAEIGEYAVTPRPEPPGLERGQVSEYVGCHIRDLPGDKSAAVHRPGCWCIWVWEPHRNFWTRWYEPQMVCMHQRSWPQRQTAERHYQRCIQNLVTGARYALIDGDGVVHAYAEKEVEQ